MYVILKNYGLKLSSNVLVRNLIAKVFHPMAASVSSSFSFTRFMTLR